MERPSPTPVSSGPNVVSRVPKSLQVTRPNLGARLVKTGGLYFAALNEQGKNLDLSYSRPVKSEEQPFGPRNHIKVGEIWQPLNLAWFAENPGEASTFVVVNEEGQFKQVIPTPEETVEAEGKIIELGMVVAFVPNGGVVNEGVMVFALVYPSGDTYSLQSQETHTPDITKVRIRCRRGDAKYSLTIFPR